jgi:hypothetical protein
MPVLSKRRCQPIRQAHITQPPTLRGRHVALPFGTLNTQLSLGQINITPFECHHFAATQARLTTKQHNQQGLILALGRFDQLLLGYTSLVRVTS